MRFVAPVNRPRLLLSSWKQRPLLRYIPYCPLFCGFRWISILKRCISKVNNHCVSGNIFPLEKGAEKRRVAMATLREWKNGAFWHTNLTHFSKGKILPLTQCKRSLRVTITICRLSYVTIRIYHEFQLYPYYLFVSDVYCSPPLTALFGRGLFTCSNIVHDRANSRPK